MVYCVWKPVFVIKKLLQPSLYHSYPFPANDLYVNPNDIKLWSTTGFLPVFYFKDRVIDGDWDKSTIRFEDIKLFKICQERFGENKEWREIPLYQEILNQIEDEKGIWLYACTKEELDTVLMRMDRIYQSIKKEGFKTQRDITTTFSKLLIKEEVSVNIARDGDLLFNDGRHRLTIAKLLGIERLPVTITVRHAEWVRFKYEILDYTREHNGKVYTPLTHPDLQSIPSTVGHDRFKLIRNNLSSKKGTLLDMKAHWGYFCHRFEDEGFECYAVENESQNLYFLRKLKRAQNKQFTVVPESIFSFYMKKSDFDVVLALGCLHHFTRTEKELLQFVELLKTLDIKEMFFEPSPLAGPQAGKLDIDTDELVDFILKNSCLTRSKFIGYLENNTPLIKISQ